MRIDSTEETRKKNRSEKNEEKKEEDVIVLLKATHTQPHTQSAPSCISYTNKAK